MADINTASFSGSVIKKIMTKEEFVNFIKQYNANRKTRRLEAPQASDFAILKFLKQTKSVSQTAKKFGIATHTVNAAMTRISAWEK